MILIIGYKNLHKMQIGIIDYGAGNINSVYNTIYNLGYNPIIIEDVNQISNIDRLIVPGVGSAFKSLEVLKKRGFFNKIQNLINSNIPILGICLGFQIFSKKLFEDGESNGLNLIEGNIVPINKPATFNIGWNIYLDYTLFCYLIFAFKIYFLIAVFFLIIKPLIQGMME